jgi:uncharacterized protein (DUF1697 family)
MTKYVAFLRGINVGGKKIIKMEILRGIFEALGMSNVQTYIASGNVLFDTRARSEKALRSKLESGMGHEVRVALFEFPEVASIVDQDPFKGIKATPDVALFVTFLAEKPKQSPKLPFVFAKENLEVIALVGRAAFIVARRKQNGMFGFPNDFIEKQFGVTGTTRNWNTVQKIAALVTD